MVDEGWVVSDSSHDEGHMMPPCYICSWKKTMHLIGKIIFDLRKKNNIGGITGASDAPPP